MGKNSSIKNLSLAAFVGLFACYGFTAHNIRIGSISTEGLVIKYSKRSIASTINCPIRKNAIDETTVDASGLGDCFHHVESKTLDNDDVEYTVTTYYKGFTSTGTKIFSKEDVEREGHNEDFIIGLVRSSKEKFDLAEEETQKYRDGVELAGAEEDEPASDLAPKQAPAPKGRPDITVDSSVASDDDETEEDLELEAEALEDAILDYANLKEEYNSCQSDEATDKEIKSIIKKYDRTVLKYAARLEKYNESERGKHPFEKLTSRGKEKLEDFMAAVDEAGSIDSDDDADYDTDSEGDKDQMECLLDRSKNIKNKEAQFVHYAQHIQPQLRQAMVANSSSDLEQRTRAITEEIGGDLLPLARNNQFIMASIQADNMGASARAKQAEISAAQVKAQSLAEPMRTNTLKSLQNQSELINSELASNLSQLTAVNGDALSPYISDSGTFWAQQLLPLQTAGLDMMGGESGDGTVVTSPGVVPDNSEVLAKLKKMYDRMAKSRDVTGNGRGQAITPRGQVKYNADGTRVYKGVSVPRLGDAVQSGSIQ